MSRRFAGAMAWALACALLGGCATEAVRIHTPAPIGGRIESADRMIIAAVENRPNPFVARAGGTPRGYDSIDTYGPSASAARRLLGIESDYRLREVSAWPILPLHLHCAMLEIPQGADRAAVLASLTADPRIKLAEPLQTFVARTSGYNDPYVDLEIGFKKMQVADAQAFADGSGVKVALIDTGVDTQHPDLKGRIDAAYNFVDADSTSFRADRHGTEMAGVISAVANNHEGIVGIAPAARLVVLKACWQLQPGIDAAHCNSFSLARALVTAFDAHAQVINLSLTGPADPLLGDLLREGLRRGILIVGAAAPAEANDADDLFHNTGVIEVASTRAAQAESALHAPGQDIFTLLPNGRYDFASGDSIATAQVTGVIALMLQRDPHLSLDRTRAILQQSSVPLDPTVSAVTQVNACAALSALIGHGACP